MQDVKLAIQGMHCDGCVRRVTLALQKVDGAEVLNVNVGSADVRIDERKAKPEDLAAAVNRIGFHATAG